MVERRIKIVEHQKKESRKREGIKVRKMRDEGIMREVGGLDRGKISEVPQSGKE